MTFSSLILPMTILKKRVDFKLFCCRLGIELNSVDVDLELKELRIWGFGARKAGDLGI